MVQDVVLRGVFMKKLIAAIFMCGMMTVNVFAAEINVNLKKIDEKPVIVNNRVLVPVRGVFEQMGYSVDYDVKTKTATLKDDSTNIVLINGNTYFTVNNTKIVLDVPQQIINGRFMIPLRAVGEAIGAVVNWDADSQTAYIISKDNEKLQTALSVIGDMFEEKENNTVENINKDTDNNDNTSLSGDEADVENILRATIDGTPIIFYLQETSTAKDGYEVSYVSFKDNGEPQYRFYMRLDLSIKAGTHTNESDKYVCYISLSTKYNPETEKWGDTYTAIHDKKGEKGIYTINLDKDINYDVHTVSGTFSAELRGSEYSKNVKGKHISVTNGSFHYNKNEVHPNVQRWLNDSVAANNDNVIKDTTVPDFNLDSDENQETICPKCNGEGKIKCTSCDGKGYLYFEKSGINFGSGSGGKYTEKVKCGCDNGYNKCWKCGGTGYIK